MKKLVQVLILVGLTLFFTGCGEKVVINSGEVGKQLTTSGLEKEIRAPGAFRMDSCFFGMACPKLVRLQVSETTEVIPGKFFINKSDLELELELSLQYAVKKDEKSINGVFERIKAEKSDSNQMMIPNENIYNAFIRPVIRDTVRVALNNYSIDEIMNNLSDIKTFTENEVRKVLKDTPIDVITLAFSKVGYPEAILKAKEDFAKIELEKATKMRAIAAELEILKKTMELEKERAKMTLEVDEIIATKMNTNLEKYLTLQAINKSAENGTPWALGMFPFK